jgi:hypothetical protein
LCLEVSLPIEKVVGVLGLGIVSLLDVSLLVVNTGMGGTIVVLGPRGATGHGLPFVVRVVLQGDMWCSTRSGRMDFANPTFEQMARHWFDSFCTNPSAESFAHSLAVIFYFAGGRHGRLLVDRLRLLSTHDWRSTVVLQPHPVMTKEPGTMGKVECFQWAR